LNKKIENIKNGNQNNNTDKDLKTLPLPSKEVFDLLAVNEHGQT